MPVRKKDPRLFVLLGVVMILGGTYAMLTCMLGGRLSPAEAWPLPFGFTTVATGAMLLTRTQIAVFFLFLYAVTLLILGIVNNGFTSATNLAWLALLALCLPLAKNARK